MPGHLDFDFRFGNAGRRRDDDEPMCLLVLGDFSGTPATDRPPLASRPILRVDVDNLDDAVRRFAPRLTVPSGTIAFERIDDFHPDRLYARLDLFRALRQARTGPPPDAGDQLGRLLGKPAPSSGARAAAPAGGIDALIRDIVAPYIVRDTTGETVSYVAGVDTAIAEQMRALLHDPGFQSLESAWRGIHWLVTSLDLDERLQVHLLDVTREELLADLLESEAAPARTSLYRNVVDRERNVPGGRRWSSLVALAPFGPSDSDLQLLASLGALASHAGGPLLAGADLALSTGDDEALAGWGALRRSKAARWIGLAAPRVLLRLPYGKSGDPIEAFAFEEIVGVPASEDLLWGNGSLAAALLIGRGFVERGWEMEPGDERDIDGLPAYTFLRDGERELQPCGERLLRESEIQAMLGRGLIPIASRRDRNAVVAVRFQSIADPPASLAW
jgi:type VI secretion system protein ImpC